MSASAALSSGNRAPTIGLTCPDSIMPSISRPIRSVRSGQPITEAPQPAPMTSVLLSSSRLTRTSGIDPAGEADHHHAPALAQASAGCR